MSDGVVGALELSIALGQTEDGAGGEAPLFVERPDDLFIAAHGRFVIAPAFLVEEGSFEHVIDVSHRRWECGRRQGRRRGGFGFQGQGPDPGRHGPESRGEGQR